MRSKISKLLALALAFVLLLSMAACGGKTTDETASQSVEQTAAASEEAAASSAETEPAAQTEPVKLTVWAWDPAFNIPVMKEAGARYSAINPNATVDVVEFAKADVEQKLLVNLSSGTTEGLPDIVLVEDYNAQKYISSYPGSFADLTGKVDHSQFAPYKVKLMTVDGKVYGVPFDSGVAGTFYRSDLLAQAGFKASDLENITWDRFIEIGEAVKAKTGVNMCAFDPNDGGLVRVMLQSAGAWYYDKDGKPYLAGNTVMEKAIDTYVKICKSPMTLQTSGWSEWVGAINGGKAATISTGCWIMGSIKGAADQSGKWALAPIPRLDVEGSVNASNLGGSSWYILDASKAKDTAIDFMNQTFAKDVDFYQKILVGQGAVGTYLPSQSGEAYTKADEFFGGQKVFEDFSKYIKEIPSVEYGSYTYEADAAVAAIIPSVMSGGKTADLLKDAQAQLESSIN